MRCLYCGETSWRPFRWMADGEFCSREHRKSYHERLRRIASDLAECQSGPAKATCPGASGVVETPSAQLEPNAGVCGELFPIEAPGMLAAASDYERMALANGDPAEALLQADVHPVGLQSQNLLPLWVNDEQPGVDTWQPLPVVSAVGRSVPVGSTSGMLPAGFENHAQIKRWGLRIKFPKV
jgi:hypothetical protein